LIRCIIVEDEELAQDVIISHLKHFHQFELAGVYRNAREAMEGLQQQSIDLMFLDIHLPGMTGLNFLASIKDPPLVVLTTAHREYALESYEFNVIDYLLKPISLERFTKAIQKISGGRLYNHTAEAEPTPDHIFIRSNSKFFKVNFSEIIFIEGMKDYLKIHTPEFRLVTHQTMGEMEKQLPANLFIRIHKSYIIAIPKIKAIQSNAIELPGKVLPIGISYKETVMSMIGKKG
jgi:DNA-binding LytR/AlgR family response regulator